MHIRQVSLLIRKRDSAKDRARVLLRFKEWQAVQRCLTPPTPRPGKLLIIRLDDIGDYVLFRNQLAMYKRSPRWRGYEITLLGNRSWQDLFTALDADTVDETIFVRKNDYLQDPEYRLDIWRELRLRGFEFGIAPSRTRPLLLDDLCMLAAAPQRLIGAANEHMHPDWSSRSDALYQELFAPAGALLHEFRFNAQFTVWACGLAYEGKRPFIDAPAAALPKTEPYLVCCIGASTRSKRWPKNRWIEFLRANGSRAVLVGAGQTEIDMARAIALATGVDNRTGKASLTALLPLIAGARALVTNDTVAAHLGVALGRPTLIVANGVNYMRFSDYAAAGIDGVATVYPAVFVRHRRRRGDGAYNYPSAVTADIGSIRGATVYARLRELLGSNIEA